MKNLLRWAQWTLSSAEREFVCKYQEQDVAGDVKAQTKDEDSARNPRLQYKDGRMATVVARSSERAYYGLKKSYVWLYT